MSRRLISQISLLAIVFFLSVAVQSYAGFWPQRTQKSVQQHAQQRVQDILSQQQQQSSIFKEPAKAPPYGGAAAPLTTNGSAQIKNGGLILGYGDVATGLLVLHGNVGVGTSNPTQKLDVNGNIKSNDLYIAKTGQWASELSSQINSLKKQINANSLAINNNGGSSQWLYKSQHTTKQCTNLGGTVVTVGSRKVCKFMQNYVLGPSSASHQVCVAFGGKVIKKKVIKLWGFIRPGTYYKCKFPNANNGAPGPNDKLLENGTSYLPLKFVLTNFPKGWHVSGFSFPRIRIRNKWGNWVWTTVVRGGDTITYPVTCPKSNSRSTSCTTGSHSTLQNKGAETCKYYSYIPYQDRGYTSTCTAPIIAVGAY